MPVLFLFSIGLMAHQMQLDALTANFSHQSAQQLLFDGTFRFGHGERENGLIVIVEHDFDKVSFHDVTGIYHRRAGISRGGLGGAGGFCFGDSTPSNGFSLLISASIQLR